MPDHTQGPKGELKQKYDKKLIKIEETVRLLQQLRMCRATGSHHRKEDFSRSGCKDFRGQDALTP